MDNIVIYARYSSHGQTEQSIEGQLKECHGYAERNGYKVVQEYIDRALTGTSDKRPEFLQMIEDSKKKQFKYVLVYQLDRFARNRFDSASYKAKLKKNGIRVISARENISADASGILIEGVLESMAEYYSAELSQKVKRGKAICAEKCKYAGGYIPFGYKIDNEMNFEIDEFNASIVNKVFEMYAGGKPARHIMNWLNKQNVPNVRGKEWTKNSIARLLSNRRYLGIYIMNGNETPGGMPQIVSSELFHKAQAIIQSNADSPARGKAKVRYILTGKLFCGECESGWVGISGKTRGETAYHYYKCLSNIQHKGCIVKAVPKDKLELSVINGLRNALTEEVVFDVAEKVMKLIETEKKKLNLERLKTKLEQNKNKLDKVTDLLIDGKGDSDMLSDKAKSLRCEIDEQQNQISLEDGIFYNVTERQVFDFLWSIRCSDINDVADKQRFINTYVYKIYIYPDGKLMVISPISGFDYRPNGLKLSLSDFKSIKKEPYTSNSTYTVQLAEKPGFEPGHQFYPIYSLSRGAP